MKTRPSVLRRLQVLTQTWPAAPELRPAVEELVERVRRGGDRAVAEIAREVGDRSPGEVPKGAWKAACRAVDEALLESLRFARDSIERFARAQLGSLQPCQIEAHGLVLGHTLAPIERVGAYVPGGRYPLASTALMTVVPAKVAGVGEVVVCTPNPAPQILAACEIAGADRVFAIGGPQAIAAMAYGTETVPKVDKIVGPGNAHVTEAKRCVFGVCGIDLLAGPSEVLIVASRGARADIVAADLLAQAEHDVRSRVLLICDDPAFADSVDSELERQLATLPTAGVARQSLALGGAVLVESIEDSVAMADALAPEHLELHGEAAEALAPKLRHYGSLFVGSHAAEALGDYASGPNHVLPTGGAARYAAGLSVFQFLCVRTYQRAAEPVSPHLVAAAARLAQAEALEAHRRAALLRG